MYRINIQTLTTQAAIPTAAKMRLWAKAALCHKVRRGEMTIRLVDKREIKFLNKTYRHKNKPTNVLSFKADVPKNIKLKIPLLGDIVICSDVVNEEAQAQNKSADAHWAHIIIHGTLHILGYDHEIEKEAEIMESKEINLLKKMGFVDPYKVVQDE